MADAKEGEGVDGDEDETGDGGEKLGDGRALWRGRLQRSVVEAGRRAIGQDA